MRVRFLLLMFLISLTHLSLAQERVVVYREGFGEVKPNVSFSEFSGYDNPYTYSGKGIAYYHSNYCCSLPGSSGLNCGYFIDENRCDFSVEGINVQGYRDLKFCFNARQARADSEIRVIYEVDNKVFSSKLILRSKNDTWGEVPDLDFPQGAVLNIRMENLTPDSKIYFDDLVITGTRIEAQAPDAPVILPPGGLYTEPVRVEIKGAAGTTVYYTLDGTVPTENALCYSEPFTLEHSATVTAIAVSQDKFSEPVCADYQIDVVPSVQRVADFRQAGERVRLNLQQAEVVDVDNSWIYVSDTSAGVLIPSDAVSARKGDVLSGFLIGTPQLEHGMPTVAGGIYSEVEVLAGQAELVPLPVSPAGLLQNPELYMARWVCCSGVQYHDGKIAVADEGLWLSLRAGSWSEEPAWTWPEKITVTGVLKTDAGEPYLWVGESGQVSDDNQLTDAGTAGTALVLTESDGSYSAVTTELRNYYLQKEPVTVVNGKVVALPGSAGHFCWQFHNGRLRVSDGRYLLSVENGAFVLRDELDDSYYYSWARHEDGFLVQSRHNGNYVIMALSYEGNTDVRAYHIDNLGTEKYSKRPAEEMPLYYGYVRTQKPAVWGTVCLPNAVAAGQYRGALFFSLAGRLTDADGVTEAVLLRQVKGNLLAGMPYVVYGNESVLAAIYAKESADRPSSYNGLYGCFEAINGERNPDDMTLYGKYVFSSNMLRRCGAGASVGQNKAYVDLEQVPVLSQQPQGTMRISVGDKATGISGLTPDSSLRMRVYTLSGRFMGFWESCRNSLPAGVYLVHGKKILIK